MKAPTLPPTADARSMVSTRDWPPPVGQSAPCGLILLSADGMVLDVNRTAAMWMGEPGEKPRPLAVYLGVQHADVAPRLVAFVEGLREKGQAAPVALSLLRLDGTSFHAELSGTALYDPSGVCLGADLSLNDLSDRERHEAASAVLAQQDLERLAEHRTRMLTEAQRDLDTMSQLVSHDLRSPLRHLRGYMGLMRSSIDEHADTTMAEYHEAMGKALARMEQMVEGLLEFSRLGRVPIDWQDVPLAQVVQAAVARLMHEHPGRQIEWRIAEDLPVVRGDTMLLTEVFTQLLDNAIKFTRGTDQAVIELEWEPTAPNMRSFTVRDNGVGFDRAHAPNLFVMFQRQHHSMDYPGLGAGLAQAQRIVQRHGGTMTCESSVGVGCRVVFTLPVTDIPNPF